MYIRKTANIVSIYDDTRMKTLSELYDFLEDKRDDKHIDGLLSYDASLPEEWQKARLEILTWWKIERIVEDENCHIDRNFAVAYFEERANVTSNKLLKYRYNYFAYLLSNYDNRFAKHSIDALIEVIESVLPKDKGDYPQYAQDAIEILMLLSKRIKYRIDDAKRLMWNILLSDYGYRTKLVCVRAAKERAFFPTTEAEKIVCLCKELFPMTKDGWRENCCILGLFYASKLQDKAKPYLSFFYESLGDLEMGQLVDPATEPNNIAIPLMNENHFEKALEFYQKAGLNEKRNKAEQKFRENKKNVVMPSFKVKCRTDKRVVKYFGDLATELLAGHISTLSDATITVVAPNENAMKRYTKWWNNIEFKDVAQTVDGLIKGEEWDYDKKFKDFNLTLYEEDNEVKNNSSIAFVLSCHGYNLLFSADSCSSLLSDGLKNTNMLKDGDFKFDLMHIPHHGSCRNSSFVFLTDIICPKYVISGNGANRYHLPDKETIARLNAANPTGCELHFTQMNFKLKEIFANDDCGNLKIIDDANFTFE